MYFCVWSVGYCFHNGSKQHWPFSTSLNELLKIKQIDLPLDNKINKFSLFNVL